MATSNSTTAGTGVASGNVSAVGLAAWTSATVSNVSNIVINANATAGPSIGTDGKHGVPGGVIALLLCLLVLGVAVLCIMLYLKRTGKLYKMIPFKPLTSPKRSSSMSSNRALDADDREAAETEQNHRDDAPTNTESTMFTIEDFDMDTIDIDRHSRGTSDDYFYDEVFGKSVFEDEVTNASMRELYLASEQEEEEMFDVDAIVNSITGTDKSKTTKT